jgi:hypothetical protein
MRRLVVFAAFATSVLIATAGARAKAPPSGFEVCGPQACTAISEFAEAEPLAIGLWFGGDDGAAELSTPAATPAPFYALHWAFQQGDVHTGYYVPLLNVFRYVGDPGAPTAQSNRLVHWIKLGQRTRTILERLTATLEPFPSPVLSHVTVAGKAVRDPQSYLRLWSVAGRPTHAWPRGGFLRIKVTCNLSSPWTDAAADLRISRRGAYMLRDSTVLRIPLRLARQVRARASVR